MKASYGFVETRGFVAAILAADAMVKAAKVELVPYRKIGAAYVTVIVKGELGACQAAVDAGVRAAEQVGQLVSYHIIANPYEDTEDQLETPKKPRRPDAPKGRKRGRGPGTKTKAKKREQAPSTAKAPKPLTDEQQVLNYLQNKPDGLTLTDLSNLLNQPAPAVRLILKQLMDQGKVEKIQQKYFKL